MRSVTIRQENRLGGAGSSRKPGFADTLATLAATVTQQPAPTLLPSANFLNELGGSTKPATAKTPTPRPWNPQNLFKEVAALDPIRVEFNRRATLPSNVAGAAEPWKTAFEAPAAALPEKRGSDAPSGLFRPPAPPVARPGDAMLFSLMAEFSAIQLVLRDLESDYVAQVRAALGDDAAQTFVRLLAPPESPEAEYPEVARLLTRVDEVAQSHGKDFPGEREARAARANAEQDAESQFEVAQQIREQRRQVAYGMAPFLRSTYTSTAPLHAARVDATAAKLRAGDPTVCPPKLLPFVQALLWDRERLQHRLQELKRIDEHMLTTEQRQRWSNLVKMQQTVQQARSAQSAAAQRTSSPAVASRP